MKKIKWTTVSSWVEETLELFGYIDDDFNISDISKKIDDGEIFSEKKVNSAKRVFTSIKSRYLNYDQQKIIALSKIINSNISDQEKKNYLLIFYLEYETLAQLFMDSYVFNNFTRFNQKVFTQMDLDKFFEMVFDEYSSLLPCKLQDKISDSSMTKVRNVLYKNIASFGWIDCSNDKITFKRPSLTPEWFVFTLYLFFEEESIYAKDVYTSKIYKRFLLNEFDIEYLVTGAKLKGLIDTNKLGDINTITKKDKGLIDYAKRYQ